MNGKLCTKCNQSVSLDYTQYCYTCHRIIRGRSPTPKWRRDNSNKTMCSKCKQRPRLTYHRYCRDCKLESQKEWAMRHGGWWAALSPEQKRRNTVRLFLNHKIHRGKWFRLPCDVCGEPSQHHHLDYNNRTENVRHLCRKHHLEEERNKKLTDKNSSDTGVA